MLSEKELKEEQEAIEILTEASESKDPTFIQKAWEKVSGFVRSLRDRKNSYVVEKVLEIVAEIKSLKKLVKELVELLKQQKAAK